MKKTIEERPYQLRIREKVRHYFNDGAKSQLIESPPGSGKTIMAFQALADLREDVTKVLGMSPDDLGIGWVAMRRNLLTQAARENVNTYNIPNIFYISMFDKHLDDHELHNFRAKILVFDEAHHEATESAHNVTNIIDPQLMLGLSATPQRIDRMKLCFEVTIKDAGFPTLILDGYLAQYNQFMLNDFNPKTVAKAYLEDKDRWGKSIMYFLREDQCDECAEILKAGGVRCDVVTCKTDRYKQLDRFEEDKLDVLLNMMVLTEGFDCPSLKTVFVRDTHARSCTTQMCGRVLRPYKGLPIVNIVQSLNTTWPFTKIARAHAQYVQFDNGWRSVGTSEYAAIMTKHMMQRIINAKPDIESINWLMQQKKYRRRRF